MSDIFSNAAMRRRKSAPERFVFFVALLSIGFALLFAWFTHLYVCFTTGAWGFLIAGAIFFPVGIIHGMGHWIGLW